MARLFRPVALALAAALVIAACSSGDGDGDADVAASEDADGSFVTVPQVESSPAEDVVSALDSPRDGSFPTPIVDPDALLSGGPPPDGIPSIDEPKFLRAGDVDFLEDQEPVLALTVGDESRAYPVQILIWHELVNDTLDGVPVTVSYCPLCNSAIAYDRRIDDRVLDFGTSGMLYNSALVMYDRQTESLWSHFTGQAIIGALTGTELEIFPMTTVSWAQWREANPDALVLSRETGHSRNYGVNPYPGYDDVGQSPFLFDGEVDGRLAAKQRVVGIERGGESVAIVTEHLAVEDVIEVDVGGSPVVVWSTEGTASALDRATVSDGRDVGATGAFQPVVDGQALTFTADGDGFVDDQTGSRWNVFGEAVSGSLSGERLTKVEHVDTFWFAWAAFRPDTTIVDA